MRSYIQNIIGFLRILTDPIGRNLLNILTRIEGLDTDDVKDFQDKEDRITEEFKDVFAYEVVIYCVLPGLIIISVAIYVYETHSSIRILGLVISFLGSVSLARSSVRGRAGIVVNVQEASSRGVTLSEKSTPDPGALRAKCRHTVHGVFGAVMLAIGFFIQTIGSL